MPLAIIVNDSIMIAAEQLYDSDRTIYTTTFPSNDLHELYTEHGMIYPVVSTFISFKGIIQYLNENKSRSSERVLVDMVHTQYSIKPNNRNTTTPLFVVVRHDNSVSVFSLKNSRIFEYDIFIRPNSVSVFGMPDLNNAVYIDVVDTYKWLCDRVNMNVEASVLVELIYKVTGLGGYMYRKIVPISDIVKQLHELYPIRNTEE